MEPVSVFLMTMMKRKKSPAELVRLVDGALVDVLALTHCERALSSPVDNLTQSESSGSECELCTALAQMKEMLVGDAEKKPDACRAQELALLLINEGTLVRLVQNLASLPFEARKDCAIIFNIIVRKNLGEFIEFLGLNFQVVETIVNGYANPNIALNCGSMVRECIRYESILQRILYSETLLLAFFERFVLSPNFDVAFDAFKTLRDLLTRKPSIASAFLETHYEQVFTAYQGLLESGNYVTRRQSLKLLGELLLDRSNFAVMMRYISCKENLKRIMILFGDKSAGIQFEAFHVFKIFVANPKKSKEVAAILFKNKDKLIAYLEQFHLENADPQFQEEKTMLISILTALQVDVAASLSPGCSGTLVEA